MPNTYLLLVDDDPAFYAPFRDEYKRSYIFEYASTYERGLDLLKREHFDAAIFDLQFPPKSFDFGLSDILPRVVKLTKGKCPVIVATEDDRPDTRSKAIKAGANLLLPKSEYSLGHWDREIQRAIQQFKKPIAKAVPQFKEATFEGFVSVSPAMEAIKNQLRTLVNYHHVSILLFGETGVGKEMLVRFFHAAKNNPNLPLLMVNLSALSKELVASELFGHVKGSFTGAEKEKVGYFESAKNGTLFLDEIGELSHDLQVQLLTVLGNRSFQKVGASDNIPLEAQLVFATNVDMEHAVEKKQIRADFYERIGRRILIPPLRERKEDILPLIEHFLPQMFGHPTHPLYGKALQECFTPKALQILQNYDWPANVRQLRNVLQDLVIDAEVHGKKIIDTDLIPHRYWVLSKPSAVFSHPKIETGADSALIEIHANNWPPKKVQFYLELQAIDKALKNAGGRKSDAARALNLKNDQNVRSKIKACVKKFPELLDSFSYLKTAYKI